MELTENKQFKTLCRYIGFKSKIVKEELQHVSRRIRLLNKWLLFCILLAVCALPFSLMFVDEDQLPAFSFSMPSDDLVLMHYSQTARHGRYLVPIDDTVKDAAPYTSQGETFVPARFLAKRLDTTMTYNAETGSVKLLSDEGNIEFDRSKTEVKGGLTYIPLRKTSEAFGRYLQVHDGVVLLSKKERSPSNEQWEEWRAELAANLAYDAYGPYSVDMQGRYMALFKTWSEAVAYARKAPGRTVLYRGEHTLWDPTKEPPASIHNSGAPFILQLPELPRGCEVTALAMLLQHDGIKVDKMELAKNIRRDPTPYAKSGGVTSFGNPHDGFVGDIYTFKNPGLGVYHEPIAELAEKYAPGRVLDITGTSFDHLLWTVGQGSPVWVIHTTLYDAVPASAWQTWQTPSGKIQITYYMHSLLVTGYDSTYVYVHDPLGRAKKIKREAFQRGWEQMGSQAIYLAPAAE